MKENERACVRACVRPWGYGILFRPGEKRPQSMMASFYRPNFLLLSQLLRNATRMVNRLAGEKSPYLLQHASNPIDWHPWGEEAFREAREKDRLIFLSVGYSTCHWCHVMERESFENQEVFSNSPLLHTSDQYKFRAYRLSECLSPSTCAAASSPK